MLRRTLGAVLRRFTLVGFCLLATLGLLACSGSSPSVSVIDAASSATQKATFVHVTLQAALDGQNVLVSDFAGATDGSLGKGTITVGGQDIAFVIAGGNYYYGFADLPAGISWVELTKADVASSGFDANSAAAAGSGEIIALLKAKGASVTKVGPDTIDSTAVTHYRAVTPTASLVASAGLSASLRSQLVGLFGSSVPFEIWVDAKDRPRKVVYEADLAKSPNRPQGLPATGKLHYEMSFRDWDVPVVASAPDPGTTMSLADYQALNSSS